MTREEILLLTKNTKGIYDIVFTYTGHGILDSTTDSLLARITNHEEDGVNLMVLVQPQNLTIIDRNGKPTCHHRLVYDGIDRIKEVSITDLPLYIGKKTTKDFEKIFRGIQ